MTRRRRVAIALLAAVAPALAVVASPARADDGRPLAPGLGPPGGLRLHVNPVVPPGYDAERFLAVARRTLERWGNTFAGLTLASPDDGRDGRNVIGFSATLPSGKLGRYQWREETTVVRTPVRRCATVLVRRRHARAGPWSRMRGRGRRAVVRRRRCHTAHRVQRVRHYEGDVRLTVAPPLRARWQFGPARPLPTEFDLETVLIHELGHASGLEHTHEPCAATSPMTQDLAVGDWWRAPDDRSRLRCVGADDVRAPDAGPVTRP